MALGELVSLVSTLVDLLVDAWRDHDDGERARIAQAITSATASMAELVLTAGPSMTMRVFEIECRGLIAVQLAQAGINADDPPLAVKIARDAAVYGAIAAFKKRRAA